MSVISYMRRVTVWIQSWNRTQMAVAWGFWLLAVAMLLWRYNSIATELATLRVRIFTDSTQDASELQAARDSASAKRAAAETWFQTSQEIASLGGQPKLAGAQEVVLDHLARSYFLADSLAKRKAEAVAQMNTLRESVLRSIQDEATAKRRFVLRMVFAVSALHLLMTWSWASRSCRE